MNKLDAHVYMKGNSWWWSKFLLHDSRGWIDDVTGKCTIWQRYIQKPTTAWTLYVRNSYWASYHHGLQKSKHSTLLNYQHTFNHWASRNSVSVNFNLFLGYSFWKKFSPKSLNSTGTIHRHYQHGDSCGIFSCDRWKFVE